MKAIQLFLECLTLQRCLLNYSKGRSLFSKSAHSATKWTFGFMRKDAEGPRTVSHSSQDDLHGWGWIKPLQIILTAGHLDPCVVKMQKSTLKFCLLFIHGAWALLARQTPTTELYIQSRSYFSVYQWERSHLFLA